MGGFRGNRQAKHSAVDYRPYSSEKILIELKNHLISTLEATSLCVGFCLLSAILGNWEEDIRYAFKLSR